MAENIFKESKIPTPLEYSWLQFRKNGLGMLGFWGMAIFLIIAILAPLLAPFAPGMPATSSGLYPPSWFENGQIDYFLGTDDLGYDLLSELIHGTRYTFGSAVIVVAAALIVGGTIGIMAGMSRGVLSSILHHLLDTTLSIPSLLLAIIIVAILGPNLANTLLAVWLALLPQFIRSIYHAVHLELQKEYITAIRLDGATKFRILRFGIIPNILESLIAQTTRGLSTAIIDITALGFVGLGAQPPLPEWGAMLGHNKDLLFIAPWTVAIPGLTILLAVFFTNLFGEGLRQAAVTGAE